MSFVQMRLYLSVLIDLLETPPGDKAAFHPLCVQGCGDSHSKDPSSLVCPGTFSSVRKRERNCADFSGKTSPEPRSCPIKYDEGKKVSVQNDEDDGPTLMLESQKGH